MRPLETKASWGNRPAGQLAGAGRARPPAVDQRTGEQATWMLAPEGQKNHVTLKMMLY
jgi:hypothetical protein